MKIVSEGKMHFEVPFLLTFHIIVFIMSIRLISGHSITTFIKGIKWSKNGVMIKCSRNY